MNEKIVVDTYVDVEGEYVSQSNMYIGWIIVQIVFKSTTWYMQSLCILFIYILFFRLTFYKIWNKILNTDIM